MNVSNNRKGIALLIVLGMLSLLMIMVVAFTTLMRQQRAASANYRHQNSARNILQVALTRALNTLDEEVGDDRIPDWHDGWVFNRVKNSPNSSLDVKSPEDVMVSVDRANKQRDPFPAFVMTSEMQDHMTVLFKRRVMQNAQDNNQLFLIGKMEQAKPEWIPVHDTEGSLVGRYSYIVLHTSGLLDAAATGSLQSLGARQVRTRSMGRYPEELRLDQSFIPEFENAGVDGLEFLYAREMVAPRGNAPAVTGMAPFPKRPMLGRIDSLKELVGATGNQLKSVPPDNKEKAIFSFRTFSRSVPELLPEADRTINNGNKICIATKADIDRYKNEIIAAFEKILGPSGLTAYYGGNINQLAKKTYASLLDFTNDADPYSLPAGDDNAERYERPTVKPVPLPFSVGIRVSADKKESELPDPVSNGTIPAWEITMKYSPYVYFDFPFVSRAGGVVQSPKVTADITYQISQGNRAPATEFATLALSHDPSGQSRFTTLSHSFDADYTNLIFDEGVANGIVAERKVTIPQSTSLTEVSMIENVKFRVDVSYGRNLLAQRPAELNTQNERMIEFAMDISIPLDDMPTRSPVVYWSEALDSRSAWKPYEQWIPKDDGTGRTNTRTLKNIADQTRFNLGEPTRGDGGLLINYLLESPSHLDANFLRNSAFNLKLQVDGVHKGAYMDDRAQIKRVYIRNGPLASVGELGFIPLAPCFTITLYDAQNNTMGFLPELGRRTWSSGDVCLHPVLDYFTLDDETPVHGKVNLNSTYRFYDNTSKKVVAAPALASVFCGMPFSLDLTQSLNTGAPSGVDSDGNVVFKNGSDIAVYLAREQKSTGPFTRLSDLAAIFDGAPCLNKTANDKSVVNVLIAGAGNNQTIGEFEREALIANAANLFTLREQTYTILLRADSFTSGFGMDDLEKGSTLGTAYGIAEVWRDPEPTTIDGKKFHRMHIQNFKVLDN